MQEIKNVTCFSFMDQERPVLGADMKGSSDCPNLKGRVYAYTLPDGIYVQVHLEGMHKSSAHTCCIYEGTSSEELGEKLLTLPDIMSCKDGNASAQMWLDGADASQIAGRSLVLRLKQDGEEKQIACERLARIL